MISSATLLRLGANTNGLRDDRAGHSHYLQSICLRNIQWKETALFADKYITHMIKIDYEQAMARLEHLPPWAIYHRDEQQGGKKIYSTLAGGLVRSSCRPLREKAWPHRYSGECVLKRKKSPPSGLAVGKWALSPLCGSGKWREFLIINTNVSIIKFFTSSKQRHDGNWVNSFCAKKNAAQKVVFSINKGRSVASWD